MCVWRGLPVPNATTQLSITPPGTVTASRSLLRGCKTPRSLSRVGAVLLGPLPCSARRGQSFSSSQRLWPLVSRHAGACRAERLSEHSRCHIESRLAGKAGYRDRRWAILSQAHILTDRQAGRQRAEAAIKQSKQSKVSLKASQAQAISARLWLVAIGIERTAVDELRSQHAGIESCVSHCSVDVSLTSSVLQTQEALGCSVARWEGGLHRPCKRPM